MYELSISSKNKLNNIHADLAAVVRGAIKLTHQDFTVIEGLRSKARQAELYRTGKTWTMESKHLIGNAVDLAPLNIDGSIDWSDLNAFAMLAQTMFVAADELGVNIRWGGDWNRNGSYRDEIKRGTYDGVHFELV